MQIIAIIVFEIIDPKNISIFTPIMHMFLRQFFNIRSYLAFPHKFSHLHRCKVQTSVLYYVHSQPSSSFHLEIYFYPQ